MPLLDVNDAFDPLMMEDQLAVERRVSTIDNHGRVVSTTTVIPFAGVVAATSPDDLVRIPEQEMMNKSITVITPFRLQGPTPSSEGDVVQWGGSRFIVRALDDFSHYGAGFVQAICASMESEDPAPEPSV